MFDILRINTKKASDKIKQWDEGLVKKHNMEKRYVRMMTANDGTQPF